jgi:hypothetical protein
MTRIHSTLIAILIGTSATVGLSAAVHTVQLGQKAAAPAVSAEVLAARKAKLAAWRHSLHATLAKHPPMLPKLPHFAPVVAAQPVAAPSAPVQAAPQQHVTYVRPPAVVKYKKPAAPPVTTTTTTTSSGDDGSGDDGGHDGGGDGGSGGGD